MSLPKLLLLDLDDVLVDYSHERRCRVLAETAGVTPETIHRAVFKSGLEKRSDAGEFGLDDYMNLLRSQWGLDILGEDFIKARRVATRVRPEMLKLCESLKNQVHLGIFTNNGHWLYQHAERIVPELMPLFGTRWVCSGSIGLRKPDPMAYVACLERLGFSAASTLFTDDKVSNTEGAEAIGMPSFVYESTPQCIAKLRQRGFNTGDSHAP